MTGYEIASIILISAVALGLIIGFLSEGNGSNNTYENLFEMYSDSKAELKKLDLELMREETKQMLIRQKDGDHS